MVGKGGMMEDVMNEGLLDETAKLKSPGIFGDPKEKGTNDLFVDLFAQRFQNIVEIQGTSEQKKFQTIYYEIMHGVPNDAIKEGLVDRFRSLITKGLSRGWDKSNFDEVPAVVAQPVDAKTVLKPHKTKQVRRKKIKKPYQMKPRIKPVEEAPANTDTTTEVI